MSKYLVQQLLPNGQIGVQVNMAVVLTDLELMMAKVDQIHNHLLNNPIDNLPQPDKESSQEVNNASSKLIITEV